MGQSVPNADLLKQMADIFEVSVSEIVEGDAERVLENAVIVDQLSRVNENLTIAQKRSKRTTKIVIGICIGIAILLAVFLFKVFQDKKELGQEVRGQEHIGTLAYEFGQDGFYHAGRDYTANLPESDGKIYPGGRFYKVGKTYRCYNDMTEVTIRRCIDFDQKEIDKFKNQYEKDLKTYSGRYGELSKAVEYYIAASDGDYMDEDGYTSAGTYYSAIIILNGTAYRINVTNGNGALAFGESLAASMHIDYSLEEEFVDDFKSINVGDIPEDVLEFDLGKSDSFASMVVWGGDPGHYCHGTFFSTSDGTYDISWVATFPPYYNTRNAQDRKMNNFQITIEDISRGTRETKDAVEILKDIGADRQYTITNTLGCEGYFTKNGTLCVAVVVGEFKDDSVDSFKETGILCIPFDSWQAKEDEEVIKPAIVALHQPYFMAREKDADVEYQKEAMTFDSSVSNFMEINGYNDPNSWISLVKWPECKGEGISIDLIASGIPKENIKLRKLFPKLTPENIAEWQKESFTEEPLYITLTFPAEYSAEEIAECLFENGKYTFDGCILTEYSNCDGKSHNISSFKEFAQLFDPDYIDMPLYDEDDL